MVKKTRCGYGVEPGTRYNIIAFDHWGAVQIYPHALVNQVTGSVARYTFEQMIGRSSVFQEVIRQGKLAALTSSNVLITGESGTGKELFY